MSAMPSSMKRTALTQYGLQILRNCKLELEWGAKAEYLHGEDERLWIWREVLESILKGWEKMLIEHEAGRRPVNRKRTWREEERKENK